MLKCVRNVRHELVDAMLLICELILTSIYPIESCDCVAGSVDSEQTSTVTCSTKQNIARILIIALNPRKMQNFGATLVVNNSTACGV